jgi:hypothetical protein
MSATRNFQPLCGMNSLVQNIFSQRLVMGVPRRKVNFAMEQFTQIPFQTDEIKYTDPGIRFEIK